MLSKHEMKRLKVLCRDEIAATLRETGTDRPSIEEMEQLINRACANVVDYRGDIEPAERDLLNQQLADDFLRLGPLEPLFNDPDITEIMVNGGGYDDEGRPYPAKVWIEKNGKLEYREDIQFDDEDHVRRLQTKMVSEVGRQLNEENPYVDARLRDGSRVNCTIPPIALDGPSINIRRFRKDMIRPEDFVQGETLTQNMLAFLKSCVISRCNIVISGGTGSGKTTMLNALSGYIPYAERVVTIEDSAELQLQQDNKVRLETRPQNSEGAGLVTSHDLLINALRQRPDRIVIGECRGAETWDMLQAMQTGHDGSLTTLHADDPSGALIRIENMAGDATGQTENAIRRQIAGAINIIVQTSRNGYDGKRRVTSITALTGAMEGNTISRVELFKFVEQGIDYDGHVLGSFQACGMQPPRNMRNKIEACGAPYDAEWFFN